MTAGARAPSGCSDSLLFCLSFPSVCHRVFVSSPSSCRYVVPCVTLFFLCGPFGVRRRFLSLSLSRFLSLPLSLFVVRVVARGSFCICCRSVPWVIVHFVSLFFSSWFFVFVCSSRPSSCFVRFVRVCTLAVWWLNWLSDGHVSPRGLGCLLGAQPLRVGSSFLRGSGSSCGGAPLHRWLRQYVVEVLSPVRVVSRPPPSLPCRLRLFWFIALWDNCTCSRVVSLLSCLVGYAIRWLFAFSPSRSPSRTHRSTPGAPRSSSAVPGAGVV